MMSTASNPTHPTRSIRTQEEVNKEWDGLAGDWDDLAAVSSSSSSSSTSTRSNPNAELFRRHVRPLLEGRIGDRRPSNTGREQRQSQQPPPKSADDEGGGGGPGGGGDANKNVGEFDNLDDNNDNDDVNDATRTAHEDRPALLRVVDFGCGTGIMIQHIMRHVERMKQQQDSNDNNNNDGPAIVVQVLAIDASSQMVEMVIDKVQSCDWNSHANVVTPVCVALARLPLLDGSICGGGGGGGGNASDNDQDGHTPPITGTGSDKDAAALRIVREWVGTADVVVACCALSCVPTDDVPTTMRQLAALLRPNGVGQLVHCEWWADYDDQNEQVEGGTGGLARDDDDAAVEGMWSEGMLGGGNNVPWWSHGMSVRQARQLIDVCSDVLESVSVEVVTRTETEELVKRGDAGGRAGRGGDGTAASWGDRPLLFGVARTRTEATSTAAAGAPPSMSTESDGGAGA